MSDLISRQDAIESVLIPCNKCTFQACESCEYADITEVIKALPSAEASQNLAEPNKELKGSDLISRADAMGAVQDHFNADGFKGYDDGQQMMDRIKALPSAEPKTGECSGCKFIGSYDTDFPCVNCVRKTKDYYCGERMRGEDGEE